jgi:arsenate reductase
MKSTFNVLFLCTGNSARSILAEALLNQLGAGRFRAFSAGSFPTGRVNPHALALLERMKIPAEGARSKSWDEFAAPGAPAIDFVITVCDDAAGEVCPVWPGHPLTAHWGVEDPARVDGSEIDVTNAFRHAFNVLEHRIRAFVALPVASLEHLALQQHLDEIGTSLPDAPVH